MTEIPPKRDAEPDNRALAVDFLRNHHVLTLAVIDEEGPWAAALFYVSHGFRCYFLSDPGTRHARAVTADPRVAATVQEQPEDWTAIRGIQIEGEARRLTGRARVSALARYRSRFRAAAGDSRLVAAFRRAATYELVPTRVFYVDNRRFGQRVEITLEGVA